MRSQGVRPEETNERIKGKNERGEEKDKRDKEENERNEETDEEIKRQRRISKGGDYSSVSKGTTTSLPSPPFVLTRKSTSSRLTFFPAATALARLSFSAALSRSAISPQTYWMLRSIRPRSYVYGPEGAAAAVAGGGA